MKNDVVVQIIVVFIATFILGACGGGGSVSTNSSANGNSGSFTENNTTIPLSGIYDINDSNETKHLKLINYVRGIGRECKTNDPNSSDPSRGSYSAAPALTVNIKLNDAAYEHNYDMVISGVEDHNGSGTISDVTGYNASPPHHSTFIERIVANGYTPYSAIGENIAVGQTTLEKAMHDWLESPGHCANIMSRNYIDIGFSRMENNSSRVYWTEEFGKLQ